MSICFPSICTVLDVDQSSFCPHKLLCQSRYCLALFANFVWMVVTTFKFIFAKAMIEVSALLLYFDHFVIFTTLFFNNITDSYIHCLFSRHLHNLFLNSFYSISISYTDLSAVLQSHPFASVGLLPALLGYYFHSFNLFASSNACIWCILYFRF